MGTLNLPIAGYHAHPGIGSSSLVHMNVSPKHFYTAWKAGPKEPTAAQARGTLFHDLLLEQSVDHYVARPLTKKGSLVAINTDEYAEFILKHPGKTPIHPNDFNELYTALTAFSENKRAMQMTLAADIESSFFAEDPETGLMLKARPDIKGNITSYLVDLKSTSYVQGFVRQIYKLMYDVRLVHYAKVIEFATGEKIKDLYFIAFESSAPFQSKIFKVPEKERLEAETVWRILINRVAVCVKENKWPGFSDEIELAERPAYLSPELVTFEEAI